MSDPTYADELKRYVEKGVIDLVAHYGYYSTLAIVMNTCRTALPEGAPAQMQPMPQR